MRANINKHLLDVDLDPSNPQNNLWMFTEIHKNQQLFDLSLQNPLDLDKLSQKSK